MYENNFQSRAMFQCEPFSVNPHSCDKETYKERRKIGEFIKQNC